MRGKDHVAGVDQLIDAAAHAMTRGEPSPDLRASVRARIGKRHAWRAVPLWVPALASAAAVVVAAIAMRPPTTPAATAPPPAAIAGAPATQPPVAGTPQAPHVARAEQSQRRERSERRERPARLIVIEPLSVPLMAVDVSSGVMPIEIEPLQVEPLQPQ